MGKLGLVPILAIGLTMAAFSQGLFDWLPEPPPGMGARAAIDRASELLHSGEVAGAVYHLHRAAAVIGETTEILIGLAHCELELDQLDLARDHLVRAINDRLHSGAATTLPGLPPPAATRFAPAQLACSVQLPASASAPAPDRLLGEAWARLAEVELQQSRNLRRYGVPERGSFLHAVMSVGRDAQRTHSEADRHAERAQRYLAFAQAADPGNATCREVQDELRSVRPTPGLEQPQ